MPVMPFRTVCTDYAIDRPCGECFECMEAQRRARLLESCYPLSADEKRKVLQHAAEPDPEPRPVPLAWVIERRAGKLPSYLGVVRHRLAWFRADVALKFASRVDAEAMLAALGNLPFDAAHLNGTERAVEA